MKIQRIINVMYMIFLLLFGTSDVNAQQQQGDGDVVYFVEKNNDVRIKDYVGRLKNFLTNKESIRIVDKVYLRKVKDDYIFHINFDKSVRFIPRIHTMPRRMRILLSFSKAIVPPTLKKFKHRLIKELSFKVIGNSSLLLDIPFSEPVKFLSKKYTEHGIKITFRIVEKRKIIIDAGHGGSDPGALGLNGEYEKNITLQFALELQELLNNTGRYTVIMTRSDDKSYPVENRVSDVMRINADMLISIHTDSNPVSQLHGMSVYTLPEILKGRDTTPAYMQNLHKSRDLAQRIISYIPDFCKIKRSPCRSVELKILKIGVPAVLMEVGCLSNKIDNELLHMKIFREKMNYAILYALDDFFRQRRK